MGMRNKNNYAINAERNPVLSDKHEKRSPKTKSFVNET